MFVLHMIWSENAYTASASCFQEQTQCPGGAANPHGSKSGAAPSIRRSWDPSFIGIGVDAEGECREEAQAVMTVPVLAMILIVIMVMIAILLPIRIRPHIVCRKPAWGRF